MKKIQNFNQSVKFKSMTMAEIQEKKLSLSILWPFKTLKRLISKLKQWWRDSLMESFCVNLVAEYQQKNAMQRSMQRPTLTDWTSHASIVKNHSGQDTFLEIIFVDHACKSKFSGQEMFWGSIWQNHVVQNNWTLTTGQGIIFDTVVWKSNFSGQAKKYS